MVPPPGSPYSQASTCVEVRGCFLRISKQPQSPFLGRCGFPGLCAFRAPRGSSSLLQQSAEDTVVYQERSLLSLDT